MNFQYIYIYIYTHTHTHTTLEMLDTVNILRALVTYLMKMNVMEINYMKHRLSCEADVCSAGQEIHRTL